jgi:precorrin-2 dehydrogenase/sirohydrochlorin ferrochelatase
MKCLPINIHIEDRKVLVVGAGNIAHRKVLSLLEYGAQVTVVAPDILEELAQVENVTFVKRGYEKGDINGACLVISATSSQDVNTLVHAHAIEAGIPVNVVDQPHLCTFIFPSIVNRGELLISVSTGGASPTLAKEIRRMIEEDVGIEYEAHVEFLAEMRALTKETFTDIATRSEIAKQLADPRFRQIIQDRGMEEARSEAGKIIEATLKAQS